MSRFLFLLIIWLMGAVPLAQGASFETVLKSKPGVWRSDGYGLYLGINGLTVKLYEVSAVSCLKVVGGSFNALFDQFEKARDDQENGGFFLRYWDYTTEVRFTREFSLPRECLEDVSAKAQDPGFNFDVLWHIYNDQYPFFEVHGVDWAAEYETRRARAVQAEDASALKAEMEDLIWQLDDVHVGVETGDEVWPVIPNPHKDAFLASIAKKLGESYRESENQVLRWGVLAGNLGYLHVGKMNTFDDADLDQVFTDLHAAGVDHLIVDLRFNRGGGDPAAVRLGQRLIDQPRKIWEIRAKEADGLSEPMSIELEPTGDHRFSGRVLVLTDARTVSAAENLTMMLRAIPGTVHLGETTQGNFSSMIGRTLPNGWTLYLGNEVWQDWQGARYEGIGITPHVQIPLDSEAEFSQGQDRMLAMASLLIHNPCMAVFNRESGDFFVPCVVIDATPEGPREQMLLEKHPEQPGAWRLRRVEEGWTGSATEDCGPLRVSDSAQPLEVACIALNQPAEPSRFRAELTVVDPLAASVTPTRVELLPGTAAE